MTRDERKSIIHRQFLFYLKCSSLVKTAEHFKTSQPLLTYRFKTYLHPEYVKLSRQGVCGEMKRYLLGKYSDRKKKEIEDWLNLHLEIILNTDSTNGVSFHTESTSKKLANKDLRYIEDYAY